MRSLSQVAPVLLLGLAFVLMPCLSGAQENKNVLFTSPAVQSSNPADLMTLRLEVPIKTLRKETNDSTYVESTLYFKEEETWDSLPVEIRTRGDFRRKKCIFPPVKLKFSRKDIENTVFDENRTFVFSWAPERQGVSNKANPKRKTGAT